MAHYLHIIYYPLMCLNFYLYYLYYNIHAMEKLNVVCMACDYLLCHIIYAKIDRTDLDITRLYTLYMYAL